MKPTIVDTHAHLDMAPFNQDREGVIMRALESGVSTIVTVGVNLESSEKAIQLAEDYPELWAAVGFHPHEANKVTEENIASLTQIADHPRVVAIGEMGLDYYRNYSSREAQLRVLKWQLELAVKLNRPVIIHCRQAEKDMLNVLRDWVSLHNKAGGPPPGVIHCFSGDIDAARQYLGMGFLLSLGAYIGYPSSNHLRNTIKGIPLDKVVLETDCPFLPPQIYRGQRNEPAYLSATAQLLTEIRGETIETIAQETAQNSRRLFRII